MNKTEFQHLIQQTKEYLLQEYAASDEKNNKWIVTDLETYNIFKDYAVRNKKQPQQQQLHAKPAPLPMPAEKVITQNVAPQIETEIQIPATPSVTNSITPFVKPASIPEPIKIDKGFDSDPKQKFQLEPLKLKAKQDLNDVKKLVHELFPRQTIIDTIPTGEAEVVIISDLNDKKSEIFLSNLAKAIDIQLKTCKILSSKKFLEYSHFEQLKMIIKTSPALEIKNEVHTLDLFDLTTYFTEPAKKAELWKTIENALLL